MARWGLRWKSVIALSITALIVTIAALLIGWLLISEGREYSARTYVTNFTELNYQKVLTPVRREIALVERFVDLSSIKAWMASPSANSVTAAFYQDVNGFKQAFSNQTLFFVADADLNYHFYDNQLPVDGTPRYQLSNQTSPIGGIFNSKTVNCH